MVHKYIHIILWFSPTVKWMMNAHILLLHNNHSILQKYPLSVDSLCIEYLYTWTSKHIFCKQVLSSWNVLFHDWHIKTFDNKTRLSRSRQLHRAELDSMDPSSNIKRLTTFLHTCAQKSTPRAYDKHHGGWLRAASIIFSPKVVELEKRHFNSRYSCYKN